MFLSPLVLQADIQPDRWILAAPLVWEDPAFGRLEAPVGFITDLASTPFHVDDNGPSRRPAAMHDALYKLGRERGKDWADQFLRRAILFEGGGYFRAQAYYLGVHWFGGSAWVQDGLMPPSASDFDTPSHFLAWQLATGTRIPRSRPTISTPA
jgi:hypothetical protein